MNIYITSGSHKGMDLNPNTVKIC